VNHFKPPFESFAIRDCPGVEGAGVPFNVIEVALISKLPEVLR
jgi:hypothetical protein